MIRKAARHRRLSSLSAYFTAPASRRLLRVFALAILFGGYWALPISGQVLILTDPAQEHHELWPRMWVEPPAARPGEQITLYVRDNAPWSHVKLSIDGADAPRDETYAAGNGPWTWRWRFPAPEQPAYTTMFYHDCQTGCIERAHVMLGAQNPPDKPTSAVRPTKLGVVFADSERDWHGRAGWTVELTYTQRQEDDIDFSIDGLARRTRQASRLGLRVLVRVDYDRQQALPPAGDEVAHERFLAYCARLVRDDRLNDVYGYIIGAGYNAAGGNTLAPAQPTTPEWYARVFNGYGLSVKYASI